VERLHRLILRQKHVAVRTLTDRAIEQVLPPGD
jgi:hypothetical protein